MTNKQSTITNQYQFYQFLDKIFKILILNSLFEYLEDNKLISVYLFGFRSNDSRVNRLSSIAHKLYKVPLMPALILKPVMWFLRCLRHLTKSGTKH